MDQWKECALKSRYLLDQIYTMTGGGKTRKEFENIEPMLDMVQDIKIGDKLMGDDSKPRIVLSLARGREQMYKVIPIVINESAKLNI